MLYCSRAFHCSCSPQLIRDGIHSVAELMSIGRSILGRRHVLPSVVFGLHEMMVEGTFPSGTYLVTVHDPICSDDGDLERALYGSFLPMPGEDKFPVPVPDDYKPEAQPGAIVAVKDAPIVINKGRKHIRLRVVSRGDRPIQVRHKSSDVVVFIDVAPRWARTITL